ncbi:MAG: efflux RND transporter permease subunit [Pirellulales bacterium]|nr:efflux RND transporter permease subunit [Pirellulales bacterium]
MFARFFIERPIFAWVVSIVILLVGSVAVFLLPIAQYPDITPPTVEVMASYPGASAQVVADSVAAPIEQQVNGVERMLYMSSQCTNDGSYVLTVTFELGTDLNMAQVLVQNRVALAMPLLPSQVQVQGVTTKKKSPSILLAVNLISPDGRYDDLYLSNYATIQLKDEIARINGVGDVTFLGQRDYSMRVWLDPQKMASRNLAAIDVVRALQTQNVQVAAGQVGREPVPSGQQFQFTMSTLGRLADAEQFADVIIKTGQGDEAEGRASSQVVRLRDVGRVELGAQIYDQICHLDGAPSVGMAVFQLPGSNALDVANKVKAKMSDLAERFPDGLEYRIGYDTTPFIEESVDEVFKTLRDAIVLVAIVVLFFLQDWRAMILPMIDVPVSLVGTFAVMAVMGFSLNNLTLFGMVLAIGIVVDDAIVVLENVERQMTLGLDAKSATIKAMGEITGPIIAITLVLSSVFLPSVFVPGVTGQFFRQFALVISSAMIISAINAMTLTPSRAVAIFQKEQLDEHGHPRHEALPWWIFIALGGLASVWLGKTLLAGHAGLPAADEMEGHGLGWPALAGLFAPGALVGGAVGWFAIGRVNAALARLFGAFNRLFDRLTDAYGRTVARLVRVSFVVLFVYGGLLGLTVWSMGAAPKAFIPEQDQGYLLVNVQLPDSASVERTQAVIDKIHRIAMGDPAAPGKPKGIPGVNHTLSVAGQSLMLSANGSNFGSCFVILDPFDRRHEPDRYDVAIAKTLRERFAAEIDEAEIQIFRAPPIQGLGSGGGFKLQVEQRGYVDLDELQTQTDELVAAANANPRLLGVFTMFRADTPQYYLDIDRTKCESLGVPVQDVFDTLQVYMGGYFVNLFNAFGRTWQVNVLAEPEYRTRVADLRQLEVRNQLGRMVPLATLFNVKDQGGPVMVMRYNMYASAPVVGNPAPGTSSGDVIRIVQNLADKNGVASEWTEIMYLQILAGNATIYIFAIGTALIFLVLAAKYESWKLPLAVILVVPMCLLCAVAGMLVASLPVDIFVQIGFLVLVGLAAKNAILIVEFAQQLQDQGRSPGDAAVEAARLRLRPIVMTSFAFILGVVPLLLGTGAGAEMRRSLGTAVFAGMIGVTGFGILLTPVFYYVLMRLHRRATPEPAAPTGDAWLDRYDFTAAPSIPDAAPAPETPAPSASGQGGTV